MPVSALARWDGASGVVYKKSLVKLRDVEESTGESTLLVPLAPNRHGLPPISLAAVVER